MMMMTEKLLVSDRACAEQAALRSSSGGGSGGGGDVWLIRHGERADEAASASGVSWARSPANRPRWYDPPLTHNGKRQARARGKWLASLSYEYEYEYTTEEIRDTNENENESEKSKKRARVGRRDIIMNHDEEENTDRNTDRNTDTVSAHHHHRLPWHCVYSSPLLRALQTAEQIAKELDLPVRIVPGLAECALAVRRQGLKNLMRPQTRKGYIQTPLLTLAEARALCPECTILSMDTTLEQFEESLIRLLKTEQQSFKSKANQHTVMEDSSSSSSSSTRMNRNTNLPSLLCVSHREGIWELARNAGTSLAYTPCYCCLGRFRLLVEMPKQETDTCKDNKGSAGIMGATAVENNDKNDGSDSWIDTFVSIDDDDDGAEEEEEEERSTAVTYRWLMIREPDRKI